jgi:hypothetical protein
VRDQTISFLIEDLMNDPFIIEDLEKRKGKHLTLAPPPTNTEWRIMINLYRQLSSRY